MRQRSKAEGSILFHRQPSSAIVIIALSATLAPAAAAAELKPAASQAFDRYIQSTEQRLQGESQRGQFLYPDTLDSQVRADWYRRLRAGEVIEEQLPVPESGTRELESSGAMIQDGVALVFIPGVNLAQAKAFMQAYDEHSRYFKPDISRSKLVSRNGDDFKIYYRTYKKKIVSATLNINHDVHYQQIDATHLASNSRSTRVAEVEDPDTPGEHEKPVGNDNGYLWRTNSYWHTEEKDGGVYVECEALTLTRSIPWEVKWLGPFINSASREFLNKMMADLRTAVLSRK